MSKRHLWMIGLLLCGVFSALILLASNHYRTQQQTLTRQLEQQSVLHSLIALLTRELGYGGMIHHFKNFVMRGEPPDYGAARQAIERVERFLAESRNSNSAPHLEVEFRRIAEVVTQYKAMLEQVRQLHGQGVPAAEIDRRVQIDDAPAMLAQRTILNFLQAELNRSVHDLQRHNRRVLRSLVATVLLAVLLGIGASVLSYYYLRFALRSRHTISRLSERQRLLDAAPNPILVVAESGEIVFANAGAAKLFEVEKSDLIDSYLEQWIPDTAQLQHEHLRQLFFSTQGARTMVNPVQLQTRNGTVRDVEVCIGLYRLGDAQYAVANILDVSSMAAVRNRLDEAERKFRATFEMAPVGIVHVDLQFRLIEVNPYFARLVGWNSGELPGKPVPDLLAPQDQALCQQQLHRLLHDEVDHCKNELRFLHRDNRMVWGSTVMSLCRDRNGKPLYLIGVIEDITERKQFEQHLIASEKKFKTIAQYVNGVVWMATPGATRVLFVNDAYERVWQRSKESIYSNPRSFIDAVVPEDRGRVQNELVRHAKGTWDIHYRIERPDGSVRHIHDEGTAVRDDNGTMLYLVGLARDVTEEQLFRERLESTNQQLEKLAKFDPLTMALRRQYSTPEMEECIALFRRYKTDAALIFIDLDDFKTVNDRYGHETGDEVLIEFARAVRSCLRATDSFYRYAGDEFLILLRETTQGDAEKVVAKMRRKLPSVQVGLGQVVSIQFSCGIVALGAQFCDSARDWVRLADERMYEDKRQREVAVQSVN